MSARLSIDVVSDVVCPWCYVGKKRLEQALTLVPEVQADIHWRPFQLDPTIPQEGVSRRAYMEKKFGSLDKIAPVHERLTALGKELGIDFHFSAIDISPNTLDAHRNRLSVLQIPVEILFQGPQASESRLCALAPLPHNPLGHPHLEEHGGLIRRPHL